MTLLAFLFFFFFFQSHPWRFVDILSSGLDQSQSICAVSHMNTHIMCFICNIMEFRKKNRYFGKDSLKRSTTEITGVN